MKVTGFQAGGIVGKIGKEEWKTEFLNFPQLGNSQRGKMGKGRIIKGKSGGKDGVFLLFRRVFHREMVIWESFPQ